jgi:hypothetical protein
VLGGIGAGGIWDGLGRLSRRSRARTGGGGSGRLASPAVALLAAIVLILPSLAAVPGRFDEVDESEERIGREWVEALLPQLEPNAVVVSWWSYSTPLWYVQFVEGRRPDVEVIDDRTVLDRGLGSAFEVTDANVDRRPVYLVRPSREIPEFRERFVLLPLEGIPGSPVYRVDGRR